MPPLFFILKLRRATVLLAAPGWLEERVVPRVRVEGLPSPLALRTDPERCDVPARTVRGEFDFCGLDAGVLAYCRAGRPSVPKGIVGGILTEVWDDESISTLSDSPELALISNEWPSGGL